MSSDLYAKVGGSEKAAGIAEALPAFSVTVFGFAVVSGRIRTNRLVVGIKSVGSRLQVWPAGTILDGEAVCKLRTIVSLHAFDSAAAAGIPGDCLFKEIPGRVFASFIMSTETTQPSRFIDSCILNRRDELVIHQPRMTYALIRTCSPGCVACLNG